MDERNPNRLHGEPGGAGKAPQQAEGSTARPGSAANATSRAFVVELTPGGTTTDAFCGRVQHLTTFDGGNFTSAASLVSIICRVLERARLNEIDK
jgi:hypothetical protein